MDEKNTPGPTVNAAPTVYLDATVDGVTMSVTLTDEGFRGTALERFEHLADLARLAASAVDAALMPSVVVGEPPPQGDRCPCGWGLGGVPTAHRVADCSTGR